MMTICTVGQTLCIPQGMRPSFLCRIGVGFGITCEYDSFAIYVERHDGFSRMDSEHAYEFLRHLAQEHARVAEDSVYVLGLGFVDLPLDPTRLHVAI